MKPVPKVKCPTCKKAGGWFVGAYGPFCSSRCRLIDLGKWFNEEQAISEPLRPESAEKHAGLPTRGRSDRADADN
ncbi:MAG: DNA gyrase inhibitor YacG [Verrucomicrobia bacterium]|nr:MAG: DNA gyrase inhibitor YacG [Verrucomicrobiota bacterium]